MTVAFELGATYRHNFGDETLYFTPTERLKNGNWRGLVRRQFQGRKLSAPAIKVVFDPPAIKWERAAT